MIIGIIAIDENYAIGKDGTLPWKFPADLKHFKDTTTGHAVVMGANTWRSIGRPLPNRLNVVLTGSGSVTPQPEVMRLMTKEEVLDLQHYLNRHLFVIGGAHTYREFADVIEKWIVTHIPVAVVDADTFMPPDFLNGFEETAVEEIGDGLVVKTLSKS